MGKKSKKSSSPTTSSPSHQSIVTMIMNTEGNNKKTTKKSQLSDLRTTKTTKNDNDDGKGGGNTRLINDRNKVSKRESSPRRGEEVITVNHLSHRHHHHYQQKRIEGVIYEEEDNDYEGRESFDDNDVVDNNFTSRSRLTSLNGKDQEKEEEVTRHPNIINNNDTQEDNSGTCDSIDNDFPPDGETRKVIAWIRETLVRESRSNDDSRPSYLFDSRDVSYFLLSCDDHILGYLNRFRSANSIVHDKATRKEADKTIGIIRETLHWRKESGISDLNDFSFPIEFYSVGGLFLYTTDKFNNVILVFRVKMYQKIPELQEGMELFTTYKMFEAHNLTVSHDGSPAKYSGWALIFDLTDVTMSQCDLPQLFWLINTFLSYFPKTLRAAYVVNVPWILKKLLSFILSIIPSEWAAIVKVVSSKELTKYVESENLPDYLGGTCRQSYRVVPRGARPVEELAFEKYGIPWDKSSQIKGQFDKFLPKSEEEVTFRD